MKRSRVQMLWFFCLAVLCWTMCWGEDSWAGELGERLFGVRPLVVEGADPGHQFALVAPTRFCADGRVASTRKTPELPLAAFTMSQVIQKKSIGRAFLLSLLLPGLGEDYVGSKTKSRIFLATEVALWAGFLSLRTYGGWREEDYRAYAASYGGVSVEGKPHGYFVDIGNYQSIDEYNATMLRERNLPEVYKDTQAYYWAWPSEDQRVQYVRLRVSADDAYQHSVMLIGAVVANHIISAIDALWSARRHNKRIQTGGLDLDLHFGVGSGGGNVVLSARKSF